MKEKAEGAKKRIGKIGYKIKLEKHTRCQPMFTTVTE
jgi:hypothetical protein